MWTASVSTRDPSIFSRGEDGAPALHPPLVWQIELDEDLADTKLMPKRGTPPAYTSSGIFPAIDGPSGTCRYRDDVRRFVKGDPGLVGAIASRLDGSADIYQERAGHP